MWGLPGYENEELADEFAAVRQRRDPDGLAAFVQWLNQQDSTSEALEQLTKGDRHPISIQRTRNIKAASENPQLLERWERLLSPHARPASTASTLVARPR
jgi:flagellar biosynthesis/type III secretory pathway chaperone